MDQDKNMEQSLGFSLPDLHKALTEVKNSHLRNENSFVLIISKREGENVKVDSRQF